MYPFNVLYRPVILMDISHGSGGPRSSDGHAGMDCEQIVNAGK